MTFTHEEMLNAVRKAGENGQAFSCAAVRDQLNVSTRNRRELSKFHRRFKTFQDEAPNEIEKIGNNTYRLKSAVAAPSVSEATKPKPISARAAAPATPVATEANSGSEKAAVQQDEAVEISQPVSAASSAAEAAPPSVEAVAEDEPAAVSSNEPAVTETPVIAAVSSQHDANDANDADSEEITQVAPLAPSDDEPTISMPVAVVNEEVVALVDSEPTSGVITREPLAAVSVNDVADAEPAPTDTVGEDRISATEIKSAELPHIALLDASDALDAQSASATPAIQLDELIPSQPAANTGAEVQATPAPAASAAPAATSERSGELHLVSAPTEPVAVRNATRPIRETGDAEDGLSPNEKLVELDIFAIPDFDAPTPRAATPRVSPLPRSLADAPRALLKRGQWLSRRVAELLGRSQPRA
ncbi:MAG: hypothetical protein ABW321_30520 [Polyangiales bacterium]